MARSNDDLTLRVGFDIDKFRTELAKTNSTLNSWSNGVVSSLKKVALGFSALAIGRFVLDVSKLAGEAEGVSAAFNKLPQSVKLMEDLKKATGGTVSELELMKRSVMASNFDISLKALPQLLEFATLRARQTGQSVDYLVDSIVTGIGRKSKLILDNLGISAVQLTEALGGASAASSTIGEVAEAVGKIASQNLEKMGHLTEDTSTKLDRLSASWDNLKVAIGNAANGTGILGNAVDAMTASMDLASSKYLSFWEKLAAGMGPAQAAAAVVKHLARETAALTAEEQKSISVQKQADQAIKTFGNNLKAIEAAYKQNINFREIMAAVTAAQVEADKAVAAGMRNEKNLIEELNGLREEATLVIGREREAINGKIQAIEAEIEALRQLGDAEAKRAREAQARRMAGQSATPGYAPAGISGIESPAANITGSAGAAFEAVKTHMQDLVDTANAQAEEFRNTWKDSFEQTATQAAIMGDTIGFSIGELIAGTEDFSRSLARMARNIIAQLERVAMAYVITNAARLGIGPGQIAAMAVGFGIVKGAFNKIGSSGGGGPEGSMSRRDLRRFNDTYTPVSQMGNRVTFVIKGDDLHGVLRNNGRTRNRFGT